MPFQRGCVFMKTQDEAMHNFSLFDFTDDTPNKKLCVAEAEFNGVHMMQWEDLFQGFDELYAVTYSSNIDFIGSVLPHFKYAEIIFGCEAVLEEDVAMVMSLQLSQLKFLAGHKSAHMLAERLKTGSLRLFISREVKSHEKIYILKSDDGRVRVITGSANLSYSAFYGIQRENITYMENIAAYDYYKAQFEAFREACADNVVHTSLSKMIANPDASPNNLLELIPIAETVQTKKMVILEESENPEYIIAADANRLSADIKPLMPKKDKQGKVVLVPSTLSKIKRKYNEVCAIKKEERKKMPQLHIDTQKKNMTFDDMACDLSPDPMQIQSDLNLFFSYMDGFCDFSGDIEKNRRAYFLFANWYFASPFMPYLRYIAYYQKQDIKQFPVCAILYGDSNGGKTEFLHLLTKMMCGKKIPENKSSDFTATTIDRLKQAYEGIPIVIDDLAKKQYASHIENVVKYDAWGIHEKLFFYPSIAITTNQIPSVSSDISKRVFVCYIDALLDKEQARANYRKITRITDEISNAFYCAYVRRMFDEIDKMTVQIQTADDSYLPDIFAVSSRVILSMAQDFFGKSLPPYMTPCDFNDYFGSRAVGRNAIQKIRRAWRFEPDAFRIYEKKGLIEYHIPDGVHSYELKYLKQELPASLKIQLTAHTLIMDLEAARRFFEIDFKPSFFRRVKKK